MNRLNPAQLYESELTFIAKSVAEQMKACATTLDAFNHLQKFYKLVSKEQAVWMDNLPADRKKAYVDETVSGHSFIPIHQPPFFGTCELAALEEAYKVFNVEKVKVDGIEEPLILGCNYYMKLRHEPTSKMSARSAKHLSIGGVPTKNGRGVRTGTEHHSTTPIRLGEQELENLIIANAPDELKRFLRIYATDDVSREAGIAELTTRSDPFSQDRIEARGTGLTRPVAGLKALIESIGLELVSDNEQDSEEASFALPISISEENIDEETNQPDA